MTDEQPVVVSVVDDHPLFRRSVEMVISADPALAVGASAGSIGEFLASPPPSGGVVLLDFALPGVSGVDAVRQLRQAGHQVLMLTASERPEHLLGTLDAGARGYLSKSAEASQVLWAIHRVAEGGSYIAPHLASLLLAQRSRAHPLAAVLSLTEREREVLAAVAEGNTDQEIAKLLGIGVRTVRSHLDNIRVKTGRRRRAELTRLAVDEGVVDDER